jgi:hypothetical protein
MSKYTEGTTLGKILLGEPRFMIDAKRKMHYMGIRSYVAQVKKVVPVFETLPPTHVLLYIKTPTTPSMISQFNHEKVYAVKIYDFETTAMLETITVDCLSTVIKCPQCPQPTHMQFKMLNKCFYEELYCPVCEYQFSCIYINEKFYIYNVTIVIQKWMRMFAQRGVYRLIKAHCKYKPGGPGANEARDRFVEAKRLEYRNLQNNNIMVTFFDKDHGYNQYRFWADTGTKLLTQFDCKLTGTHEAYLSCESYETAVQLVKDFKADDARRAKYGIKYIDKDKVMRIGNC